MELKQSQIDELAGNKESLEQFFDRLPDVTEVARDRWAARCPLHDDSNPSLSIFLHNGIYLWKCFGCNRSGNVFQFLQEVEGISFKEAVKLVNSAVAGSWEKLSAKVDKVFVPIITAEPTTKKVFSLSELQPYEEALRGNSEAKNWLLSRGIQYKTAKALHWGFTQTREKFPKPEIKDKGFITFPYLKDEKVTAMKFRSIAEKAFDQISGMTTGLYYTSDIAPMDVVYLVEGEIDAATMVQAGFVCVALPSSGYKLKAEDRDKLMSGNQLILAGDMDNATGEQVMQQIQKELDNKRVHYLKWPTGYKDANQFFVEYCKSNISSFREAVEQLTSVAKSQVMKDIIDIKQYMLSGADLSMQEDPRRLRFPWPSVDKMSVLLPGSILVISAKRTGMGKSVYTMNITVDSAIKQGERVLNYQCELDHKEFVNMMVAYLLTKDRGKLTPEDSKAAAKIMGDAQYYFGRSTDLNRLTPVLDLIEDAIKRLGITVAVLDHIHYICRNEADPIQALANGMQRIKRMAQKYNVKFIVVAQPRKVEQDISENKDPVLSDIKGSESVTSDADTVMTIVRKPMPNNDPNNPPKDAFSNDAYLHCLKSRNKGDGNAVARLAFRGCYASFREMSYLQE